MELSMLNYIWAFMILIGVVFGAMQGNMQQITEAAIELAGEAVSLCITMLGVMSLWTGLMEIAQRAGLISRLTRLLSPFISWMFPRLPQEHEARDHIATNIIANMLGLGWAATPAGLQAMTKLREWNEEQCRYQGGDVRIASKEMCIFLIINISSLQLIPVNMIAYRSQYGSANPAAVVGPGLVATLISTLVAIVFCKIMDKSN